MAYDSSLSNRLAACRAAIDKCLNSQEYGVGSRRVRRAELQSLLALEEFLMRQEAQATSGSGVSLAQIDRPL